MKGERTLENAFLLTLIIGFMGGILAVKLKIPGGSLIGALLFSIIFNILTNNGYFYKTCADILKFITGIYLGTRINRSVLLRLKSVWKASLVMLAGLLIMNMIVGSLLSKMCCLDIGTAIMASAPGGMTELSLYAVDIGADVSTVATLQVIRVLTNIGLIPVIIRFLVKRACMKKGAETKPSGPAAYNKAKKSQQDVNQSEISRQPPLVLRVLAISAGAAAGMWLLDKAGVPSSIMIGAMIGTLIVNITFGEVLFPEKTGLILQMFTGTYIGTTINRQQLLSLGGMLPGVVLMIVAFLICTILLGVLLYKYMDIDLGTALFACAPGGISDMALIAIDMGADIAVVVSLHTIRLITLVIVIPYMISFLQYFFG